mmetsp:Transcript_25894/g.65594  ORF Transcript_25894/g.65594 Transcript_25894/m.65594 type:complete len:124 (-) Transcript_25894:1433-1804(-)
MWSFLTLPSLYKYTCLHIFHIYMCFPPDSLSSLLLSCPLTSPFHFVPIHCLSNHSIHFLFILNWCGHVVTSRTHVCSHAAVKSITDTEGERERKGEEGKESTSKISEINKVRIARYVQLQGRR